MKTVKLYGQLRKQCGGQKVFKFDVKSPAEALKALIANFPHIEKWLIDSEKAGIGFILKIGKEYIGEEEVNTLGNPWSKKDVFSIVPVPTGAINFKKWWKNPVVRIITGVVIVAAAVILAPHSVPVIGGLITSGGGSLGVLPAIGAQVLAGVGAMMVLDGVSQAISPQPEFPGDIYASGGGAGGSGGYDGPGATRLESFALSGIVNTSRQGMPCGIAYGRVFTGSAVISSGFDVDQT